jgi:nucleotide-binding universal stress UspA family protein
MQYKKVLIAVDNSAYSMKAAKTGFAIAHAMKAVIGMLYVINRAKEIINPDLGITPEQSQTILLKDVEKTIEQYIKMYNRIDEVFQFTPEGFPEHEILNIAKEWEADLIVIGTHGRSGLGRILTGSVAEYVIRHAEIPVLVIPPKMK